MAERKTITVIQIKDVVKVGDKGIEKLQFKARNEAGEEAWYFTFRPTLFDAIHNSQNSPIEIDVDVTTREYEGNTYTDRKVSQVYINGEPVAQTKGRGNYGKSPEDRAQIALQIAAKITAELWIAGKLTDDAPQVEGLCEWLLQQLKRQSGELPQEPKTPREDDETKKHKKLSKELVSILMDEKGLTIQESKEWLEENCGASLTSELTVGALENAIELAKELP